MDMMPALAPVPSLDDWATCSFLEESFRASLTAGAIGTMDLVCLPLLPQLRYQRARDLVVRILGVRLPGIRSRLLVLDALELQSLRLQGIRSVP